MANFKLSQRQREMLEWARSCGPVGINARLEGAEFRTRDSLIERGLVELKRTQTGNPGGYDDPPAYRIVITGQGKAAL